MINKYEKVTSRIKFLIIKKNTQLIYINYQNKIQLIN